MVTPAERVYQLTDVETIFLKGKFINKVARVHDGLIATEWAWLENGQECLVHKIVNASAHQIDVTGSKLALDDFHCVGLAVLPPMKKPGANTETKQSYIL